LRLQIDVIAVVRAIRQNDHRALCRAALLIRAILVAALLAPITSSAQLCHPDSAAQAKAVVRPANYIFFRRDHDRVAEPSFLANATIAGAQLTFTWRELEPTRDHYDLRGVRRRLDFLQRHGKRLVIQIQDVSFSERVLVPEYLRTDTALEQAEVLSEPWAVA